MREPGDREALAAAGGVLDQIALTCSVASSVGDQLAHGIELLVAGKDEETLAGLAAPVILLLDLVDELADEVEHAVASPDVLPEVARGVAFLGRRDGRVPGPAEAPLVERKEHGLPPSKARGDEHQLRIHREVGQAPAVGEQRLARVAINLVLA